MKTVKACVVLCLALFLTATGPTLAQWVPTSGPEGGNILGMASSNGILVAGTNGAGAFISTDNGDHWTQTTEGQPATMVFCLAFAGSDLYAGTWTGVYRSMDTGASWSPTGLTRPTVLAIAAAGENLFAGTYGSGVFISTDNGGHWTPVNEGLTDMNVQCLAILGGNLFAGTQSAGVFLSTDNGGLWTPVNNGLTNMTVQALAVIGSNLFAGTYGGGVFRSADNGASWSPVNTGLTTDTILSLGVSGTLLLAGSYDGAFLSSDNGDAWSPVNTGLGNLFVRCFAFSGLNGFAGTEGSGVWRRPLSEMIPSADTSGAVNPNGGFEASTTGVKTAPDDVAGWPLYLSAPAAASFEITGAAEAWSGQHALKATVTHVGVNPWDAQAANTPFPVTPGVEYRVSVRVRCDKSGPVINVYCLSPAFDWWGGVSDVPLTTEWREITFLFTPPAGAVTGFMPIHFAASANGPYVPYAVTIDELRVVATASGIAQEETAPLRFGISRNYPNPFNPATTVEFELPSAGFASVKVYDMSGKQAAVLAEGRLEAGLHRVRWNASGMPSGVYVCRLQAGGLSQSRKLVLMR